MEGSRSDIFNSMATARSSSNDYEDIVVCFGSLGLGEDATNAFGSSSLQNLSTAQTQEKNIETDTQSTRGVDTLLMNHRVDNNMAGYSSRNLFPHENNIWAYQDFTNYGGYQVPNLPYGREGFLGSNGHTDKHLDKPEGFSGNQHGQKSLDSCYGCFAPSSSVNQFNRGQDLNDPINEYHRSDNMWNRNQTFSRMIPDRYFYGHHDQFQETGNRGYCLPDGYNWNKYRENFSGLWNQSDGNNRSLKSESVQLSKDNLIMMARTPYGSLWLQEILKLPYPEYTQMILKGVHHSIVELMTDDNGKYVFEKLVEACNHNQLKLIMIILEMKRASFVNAALSKNGAHSIRRLIKKAKRTSHAGTITKILSTRFSELMMNPTGMYVIRQCLNHFGSKENEALYNGAIRYCISLATHEWGCIALNECINNITGLQREKLLNLIADKSDHLSNDPSGNYVVQHVLSLRNEEITSRICERLQGQYIQLALKKGGSHVVEKCIQCSSLGMILAVEEIVNHEKAAFQLARDPFGNYVMQTALKQTKSKNTGLYQSLVMALKPYYADLMRNTTGKHVFHMIKDEILLQSAKAIKMN